MSDVDLKRQIERLRAELAAERAKKELFEAAAAREQREKSNALIELAAERERRSVDFVDAAVSLIHTAVGDDSDA